MKRITAAEAREQIEMLHNDIYNRVYELLTENGELSIDVDSEDAQMAGTERVLGNGEELITGAKIHKNDVVYIVTDGNTHGYALQDAGTYDMIYILEKLEGYEPKGTN